MPLGLAPLLDSIMLPITIGIFNPETLSWSPYASFQTYEEADAALDAVCDLYPNAWVEILDGALAEETRHCFHAPH